VKLEYGRLISRGFSITWRHRWLWLLGVFAGTGGGSFSYGGNGSSGGGSSGQAISDFIARNLALLLLAAGVVFVLVLIAIVISFIARPAAIWAALELDGGHEVTLGEAWRFGRSRAWRYVRLALLVLVIFFGILVGAAILVLVDFLLFQVAVVLGVLVLIPLVLFGIGLLVLLALGLRWANYLLVVRDLDATDALRASWYLFWRHKGDTFVIGLVVGVVTLGIGIASFVIATLVSIPGIAMLVIGFQGAGSTLLIGAGALWVILIGGAVVVVSSGFLGAFGEVVNAMACRDLVLMDGQATA
jgi:hypothetical protein